MRSLARTSLSLALLGLSASPALAKDVINYQDHIRPIFQQSCFNCHNADQAKGGLDLTTYRATLAGGSSGEVVMSQSSDQSTLLGVMNHTLSPKMPPNGDKVADDKLTLIKQWIDQGLRETANSSAAKQKKPRVDLSVGKAAVGRPDGPTIMPEDMPLGPIHHTARPGAISDIAGHPWSPIVAVTGQQQVLVYHSQTNELLGVLPFAYGQPQTLRFSWTGKLLLVGGGVGGSSGTVVLYDVKTGQEVSRVGEEVDEVLAADLDPTQRFVALGGPAKRVKGYDVATGELRYNLDKHTQWVTAIAFSPDGNYLASGDRNGGLHIWEADTGLHVHRLDGHSDSVTALSWRYDGKILASSGDDGQARLWEMNNGNQVKNWTAHNGGAMSIAFAEDGLLVTTGRDQLVRVWDANGGKKFETKPFTSLGLSASFDTSSKAVVAGDLDGKLVRWSLQDKAQQVDTLASNPPPIAIALSQSAEAVAAHRSAVDQAKGSAEQAQARAQQAQQAAIDAEQTLKALHAAIKTSEQQVPKLDQTRQEVGKRYDQARRDLQQSQQQLRQASNHFKAKEGESNRIQKDYDQAARELAQSTEALAKLQTELQQAQQEQQAKPDDAGLTQRIADLTQKVKQAEQKIAQQQQKVDQQSERVRAAQKREDEAKADQDAKARLLDQAEQMEQARKQEREEANQSYDRERNDLNKARQQVRPAEAALKQAQDAQAKAKADAEQATSKLAAAEQALVDAQRSVAKWRSAEFRLRMDALARQRDQLQAQAKQLADTLDQKVKERDELNDRLRSARQTLSDLHQKLKDQDQAIAKAKHRVDALSKEIDPTKPATAEAHEDAQFDLETAEHVSRKLREAIAEHPKEIKQVEAGIQACQAQIEHLQTEIQKFGKPWLPLQSEIDALMPEYEKLRAAAGF